jgi:hypothetical protein
MRPSAQADRDSYRLIIVRRDASEILFVSKESAWSLPSVLASPRGRIAPQLAAELHKQLGIEAYCLFIPSFSPPVRSVSRANFAVLESIQHNGSAPPGTCWLPRAGPASELTHPPEDGAAIAEALCELDSYVSRSKAGPFGKPGWLKQLTLWTQEQLSLSGLRLSGTFRQCNAGPTFSLIRLETNGPAVWFKATGEPNLHELPITLLLTRLFPGNLPALLGVHPSWNAWLSEEVSNATLDTCTEPSTWETVAETLADLQIASIGRSCALLDARCKDLRPPKLTDLIPPFFARMAELMAGQQKQSPPALTNAELAFLANRLKEACSRLQDLDFPDTLGNVDFNPENILISLPRCVFIDWAEACVANPLITFEYLREHTRRSFAGDATTSEDIAASYLRRWQPFLSPDDLERALRVSRLVAIFTYAVSSNRWSAHETSRTSALAGYFRSLTRRMHREAMHQFESGEQCSL